MQWHGKIVASTALIVMTAPLGSEDESATVQWRCQYQWAFGQWCQCWGQLIAICPRPSGRCLLPPIIFCPHKLFGRLTIFSSCPSKDWIGGGMLLQLEKVSFGTGLGQAGAANLSTAQFRWSKCSTAVGWWLKCSKECTIAPQVLICYLLQQAVHCRL